MTPKEEAKERMALKAIAQNLHTSGERVVFLKMAGFGNTISGINLESSGLDFAHDLFRKAKVGYGGLDIDSIIMHGERLVQ